MAEAGAAGTSNLYKGSSQKSKIFVGAVAMLLVSGRWKPKRKRRQIDRGTGTSKL